MVTALHAPMIAVSEYIKNTNKNCDHTTSYLKVVVTALHAPMIAVNEYIKNNNKNCDYNLQYKLPQSSSCNIPCLDGRRG